MKKNITFSADEEIIQQARRLAAAQNSTLNELFRSWLERYVTQSSAASQYELLMARLDHVEAGRRFSREEMNERR